jgi:hypothetical protein
MGMVVRALQNGLVLIVSIGLAVGLLSSAHSQSPNVTVVVTGSGSSFDEAKTDAIRQALQRTMKQLVIADRAISGDTIVRDKVMSTMNGYIEKFQERGFRKTGTVYEVTTEITVSASRIENFLGVVTGGGGSIEGQTIFQEQSRRIAQAQAEQLQARARGEIFDRLFRGFPSEAMDIKVLDMKLSATNVNGLQIRVQYSFKPTFVKALFGTISSLAVDQCVPQRIGQGFVRATMSHIVTSAKYPSMCHDPRLHNQRVGEEPERDAVCIGYEGVVRCFVLAPGDYCANCGEFRDASEQGLILFGRVIDAEGQSALAEQNCLKIDAYSSSNEMGRVQIKLGSFANPTNTKKLMAIGLNLERGESIVEIDTRVINLSKAKYFVAVSGLTPLYPFGLGGNSQGGVVVNLVPNGGANSQDGCSLLDEAIQHQVLSLRSDSAGPSSNPVRRSAPVAR